MVVFEFQSNWIDQIIFFCNDSYMFPNPPTPPPPHEKNPWNKAFLQTCTICMVESKITFQVSFLCPFHIQKSQDPNFPKAFHNCIIVIWAIVLLKEASLPPPRPAKSLSPSLPEWLSGRRRLLKFRLNSCLITSGNKAIVKGKSWKCKIKLTLYEWNVSVW